MPVERFDFQAIKQPLDDLLEAVLNKIKFSWPEKYKDQQDVAVHLRALLSIARNTYNSIRYLCADVRPEASRKPEFVYSVPPLTRTILDSLFLVVFLFDDLPSHIVWYRKAGWREGKEAYARLREAHGNDPDWREWLAEREQNLRTLRKLVGITPDEEKNPKKIQRWPNPGRMAGGSVKVSPERRDFLAYLNDWFYRKLSQDSHLSLTGLMRLGTYFLVEESESRNRNLALQRGSYVAITIALLLALNSEIQIELDLDLAERFKYVWTILSGWFPEAKELYQRRYASLL